MRGLKINRKNLHKFCKERGISYLGIFGSYARGDFKRKSDVDILIKLKNSRATFFDLVRIERDLSKLIGKKVDLVTEGGLSKYLKKDILKEMKTIYEER